MRDEVMRKAGEMTDAGYHCSEAVLIAVGEAYFDLTSEIIKLSTPFAGGMGGSREDLCGGLTGGLMVIGGAMGRSDAETDDQNCQDAAAAYRAAFLFHFKCEVCCELRENWVGQPGQPDCAELVRQAAGILVDVLGDFGVQPLDKS